jgi:hypothetical protein
LRILDAVVSVQELARASAWTTRASMEQRAVGCAGNAVRPNGQRLSDSILDERHGLVRRLIVDRPRRPPWLPEGSVAE